MLSRFGNDCGGPWPSARSTFKLLSLLSWIVPALSYPQVEINLPINPGPVVPAAASSAIISPADGTMSASAAIVGPSNPPSPEHHHVGPNGSGSVDTQSPHNAPVITSTPLASSTSSQPTSSETKASAKPSTIPSKNQHHPTSPLEKSGASNYYFLLLGLLLGILVLSYWLLNRRGKAKNARALQSSQNALVRDFERDRRWTQRDWRGAVGLSHCDITPAMVTTEHREEGLNEQGEAPPPYVESVERPMPVFLRRNTSCNSGLGHHRPDEDGLSTEGRPRISIPDNNHVLGLSIPMRTLSVSMSESVRPPGYDELRRESDVENMLYHSVLRNELRRDSTRGLLSASHRGSIATQGTSHETPEVIALGRVG